MDRLMSDRAFLPTVAGCSIRPCPPPPRAPGPLLRQANRFVPDDPFTAPADPNPNYNNVDPATGKPSLEIEITMSRK